jgi:hypothetical protein
MPSSPVTVTIFATGDNENTPAEAVHHALEYARKAGFIEAWSDPVCSAQQHARCDRCGSSGDVFMLCAGCQSPIPSTSHPAQQPSREAILAILEDEVYLNRYYSRYDYGDAVDRILALFGAVASPDRPVQEPEWNDLLCSLKDIINDGRAQEAYELLVKRLLPPPSTNRETAMQALADQAQELKMGYEPVSHTDGPDPLRVAIARAIDLLTERTYGSPARSPGHNARLVLERALQPVSLQNSECLYPKCGCPTPECEPVARPNRTEP